MGWVSLILVVTTEHLDIDNIKGRIRVRDQKPLVKRAIAFEDGWDINRLVAHINEYVFFWPGTEARPIPSGINHFARYAQENTVILRIKTDWAIRSELAYCRFNSGAPRCSGGKYSPRGSQTYLPAGLFHANPSSVVEVVVKEAFKLPESVEIGKSAIGPWKALLICN
jgi:hypothetical protein